ncbi:MAG: extracellular solute-binding protein [Clostridiaceae bacterium]
MKKGLAILLVVMFIVSLSFTGCGTSKDTVNTEGQAAVQTTAVQESNAAPEGKEVSIKLWIYPMIQGVNGDGNGEFDDWAKDRAKQFTNKNPKAKFEFEVLNWQNSLEKVDVAVAAGSPPDLLYTVNNFGGVSKYGKMEALEPIDDYLTQDDWNDYSTAIQAAMKYGDKSYLWPWLKLVSAIAVNMDIVKERKAESLIPLNNELRDWTYDEFLTAARALTFSRSGKNQPDVYGYGVQGKDSMFYNYLFAVANGGSILDPTFKQYTFKSEESIDGLNFLFDLVNKYKVVPEGAAGLTWQAVHDMFIKQQIAMIPYTAEMVDEAKKAPKPFTVEFVAPPHAAGKPITAWNNVGGFIVFRQDDAYKKDKVMEFGKLLTNAENSKILNVIGCFPARNSAGNIYPADNTLMEYLGKLSNYGNSGFSRAFGLIAVPDWEIEMQAFLLKEKTAEQILDDLGVKANEALAK